MKKYPYMNPDGPYDAEKIIKLCFNSPVLIKDTYAYQDRLITLMGNIFTSPAAQKAYIEELRAVNAACEKLELYFISESGINRKLRDMYSDICAIANIKQQMGPFYFHSSATEMFVKNGPRQDITDPGSFILAAPEAAKLTVEGFNIMTMDRYASKLECERLEELGGTGSEKRAFWRHGAAVSLVYAVSRLRTGSLVMETGPKIDKIAETLAAAMGNDRFIKAAVYNFNIIRQFRKDDIRAVYSVYGKDDIWAAADMSPVSYGDLPSAAEIKEALLLS